MSGLLKQTLVSDVKSCEDSVQFADAEAYEAEWHTADEQRFHDERCRKRRTRSTPAWTVCGLSGGKPTAGAVCRSYSVRQQQANTVLVAARGAIEENA
jgi:hypothetical protein